MAKKKKKKVTQETNINYADLGKPEFDINAPATEFPCFICKRDIGTEHFCYGCRVFVCDNCDVRGDKIAGSPHAAEDHVTKQYLIGRIRNG
jgi:hypothetical protein